MRNPLGYRGLSPGAFAGVARADSSGNQQVFHNGGVWEAAHAA